MPVMKPILFLPRSLLCAGAIAIIPTTVVTAGQQAAAAPEGVRALRDLEYVQNGHERNRLDLYLPERTSGPLPVLAWFHGGGWERGDKTASPAIALATHGFAVASINYRFSQHAIFPAQIHDCKAAIRWLRANAGKYGLDADHIGAWGASAGGHLVALLGTTAGVKDLEGQGGNEAQSSRVQAVVDWYGPTDFLTVGAKDTRTHLLGGDPQANPDKAAKASPMAYVSKDAAPFLIMHGDKDSTVPIAQSELFAQSLKRAGADAAFVVVKGAGHGSPLFKSPENMKLVEDFYNKHLTKPKAPGGAVNNP
jgi:acetyl esterase/lipase